jgi:hypothetical protein
MTGTTAATGPAVGTGGAGTRLITAGFMIAGMATGGTAGGISGLRTVMTGTTAATRTAVGTGGPGTRLITAGFMIAGMAASGTAGECRRREHPVIHCLRTYPTDPYRSVG